MQRPTYEDRQKLDLLDALPQKTMLIRLYLSLLLIGTLCWVTETDKDEYLYENRLAE